jgi:tetratricopeptide (TPR) repeat protein
MNRDYNYLKTQFRLRIFEKNATEFQTFFEDIMQEAFADFIKVFPYGNEGDEGNDGFRPDDGIYYQVYAPRNPNEKQAEAARKLQRDFEKLKKTWDRISEVKTFYFVFNDKESGVSIEIEKALAELRVANPGIVFKLFLPKDMREIFFALKEETILSLGFDVDSRNALKICRESLAKLEIHLDQGNGSFVLESLRDIKNTIDSQNDEALRVEWEILECRALQQLERVKEAKEKYESLRKRFPKDPRPFLYLAEIYINEEDYDKNDEILKEAEKIDSTHWLLQLEKALRDQRLGKKIDGANIDEQKFPSDPKIRSNYYRFYGVAFQIENDLRKAEGFIERAINLNPDRLANYIAKLGVLEVEVFSPSSDEHKIRENCERFLSEIDVILARITQWGKVSPRTELIFNLEKFKIYRMLENHSECGRLLEESLKLVVQCHFDVSIDHYLSGIVMSTQLSEAEFDRVLAYLRKAEKTVSDELAKALVFQFDLKKSLFSEGRKFFDDKKKEDILGFIANLESKEYDEAWNFMRDDVRFAISIANSAKEFPDLRRKIIENLPDDDSGIQKDKIWLLLNYDESNYDEAFDILKGLDLSELHYYECRIILEIARKKKAWDFGITVLEKLLEYEKETSVVLQLKIELLNANLNLKRLPEAIKVGEEILANSKELDLLDDANKESLLAQTVMAKVARGDFPQAMALIEMYPDIPKTFEFKLGVETEVYLKNGDCSKTTASIVAGMKILKAPTPEQYAKLFPVLGEIENISAVSLSSLLIFEEECFVKFKDEERWYFVGDGDALDAKKIPSTDERYEKFRGKKLGDKITFDFKYSDSISEHVIESILPVDKYIFTQTVRHFNQLAAEGNLEGVMMVGIAATENAIDTANIVALLQDERAGRGQFFDLYCNNVIPLAFLAVSEGGLANAIGQIQNENRGFVRFSSGEQAEMEQQKEIASRIIAGTPFYIDGTSGLILAETGLLTEIYPHLPNLRVPQSVIDMLLRYKRRFRFVPGHAGFLQYAQGKLRLSSVDPKQNEDLQKRFQDSIDILESKPENIRAISSANKADCASEQKVPGELCDSCILAQKEEAPVLTEDYLFLQADEIETGKKAPEYCSTLALMRVLYEQKKLSLEKYLGFFSYLSGYRFRFLALTSDDIWNAVFGDGLITTVKPEMIKWFNFPLTLSEEYGVPFAMSFRVVAIFLMRVLLDDAILPGIAERVFLEILSAFPTNEDKRALGMLLLKVCVQEIQKIQKTIIVGTGTKKKFEQLLQLAQIYEGDSLWTPSKEGGR